MKEYKGIYHNVEDSTKSYEYGAHFKYSELYMALKNLQIKQRSEDAPSGENNNSPKENKNVFYFLYIRHWSYLFQNMKTTSWIFWDSSCLRTKGQNTSKI